MPAQSMRNSSEWRAASSSSITCTTGSVGIGHLLLSHPFQREAEDGPAAFVRPGPDSPAMRLDDGPRDGQADPHAGALRGDEGLKELPGDFGADAGPGVGDADQRHAALGGRDAHHKVAPFAPGHRIDRVADEVQDDLLHLDLVGEHEIDRAVEFEADAYAMLLGADQGERARFLDQLDQALDGPLGLAAGDEIAQPADDL